MAASGKVVRQHINVNVDMDARAISGFTDIEFAPTHRPQPRAIFLNARQMSVTSVSIDGTPTQFKHVDSHSALEFNVDNTPFIRDAMHFSAVCRVVLESPDLIIPLQNQLPATVRVEFSVDPNSTAIVGDQDTIFTDNEACGASSWFPCVDTRAQRSFFTLTIKYNADLVAVGPGESSLQATDAATHTNTMLFKIPFSVTPSAVGFCLGRLSAMPIGGGNGSTMYFTDSGETFRNTMKPIPEVMNAVMAFFDYEDEPVFPSMNFVSLPFLPDRRVFPGVCFIPPHMMLPIGNVNVVPTVLPLLVETVIAQYILFLFPVAEPEDEWWQTGFMLYFADMITSRFYSNCFQLDRRWNDISFLFVEDIHRHIVLNAVDPAGQQPYHDQYLRIKAKLLVNMIAQSMQNSDKHLLKLLNRVLRQSEEQTGFVAKKFIDDIHKFCPSISFVQFKKQWLCNNGMPIFTYNYTREKRARNVKLVIYQYSSVAHMPAKRDQFFTGTMAIQLRDLEQPMETYFTVEKPLQMLPLSYFAQRFKRTRALFKFQGGTQVSEVAYDAIVWIILDPKYTWICRVRARVPEYMSLMQLSIRRDAFAQHEGASRHSTALVEKEH